MYKRQYSYFRAIELSNAATATTLQYTGPALVLIWLALREKRMPGRRELIAVVCAMGGAFFLATHGDPSQLDVYKRQPVAWIPMSFGSATALCPAASHAISAES